MFKRLLNWLFPRLVLKDLPQPDEICSNLGRIRLFPNDDPFIAVELLFTSTPVWHNGWLYRYDGKLDIRCLSGPADELLKLFDPEPKLLYLELPITKSLQPSAHWCLLGAKVIRMLGISGGNKAGVTDIYDITIAYEDMVPNDHTTSYLLEPKEELCADQVG